MNNNWIWLVAYAVTGAFSIMLGYLFVPLLIDGQIIRADILGSLGTWAGSIATVGTLVFLIRQNIELRKQQEKQQKQQNINEEKQHEMWKSQNEMLTFQKYELHYKMFNEMLDRIEVENRFRGVYVFRERSSTYQKLFPFNNISQCTSDLSQISDVSSHSLNRVVDLLKKISSESTKISNTEPNEADISFELNKYLFTLTTILGITLKEPNQVGSIRLGNFEHNAFFNIPRALECLFALFEITNEIRRFSHLPLLDEKSLLECTNAYFNNSFYINYLISLPNISITKCNLGKHDALLKIVQAARFLDNINTHDANSLFNELDCYFLAQASPKDLKKLEQEDVVKALYEKIILVLSQTLQEDDIELSNYLNDLNEQKDQMNRDLSASRWEPFPTT